MQCFQIELECCFLWREEGGKPEDLEKKPQSKEGNQHELNPNGKQFISRDYE